MEKKKDAAHHTSPSHGTSPPAPTPPVDPGPGCSALSGEEQPGGQGESDLEPSKIHHFPVINKYMLAITDLLYTIMIP